MVLTQAEARKRMCVHGHCACMGSDCMAWRSAEIGGDFVALGYCGVAGRPLDVERVNLIAAAGPMAREALKGGE